MISSCFDTYESHYCSLYRELKEIQSEYETNKKSLLQEKAQNAKLSEEKESLKRQLHEADKVSADLRVEVENAAFELDHFKSNFILDTMGSPQASLVFQQDIHMERERVKEFQQENDKLKQLLFTLSEQLRSSQRQELLLSEENRSLTGRVEALALEKEQASLFSLRCALEAGGEDDLRQMGRFVEDSSLLQPILHSLDPLDLLCTKIHSFPSDGRLFERFCCLLFTCLGYKTSPRGGSNDRGIDFEICLNNSNKTWRAVGQCKQNSYKIGSGEVRAFIGSMVNECCHSGFFVTSSVFTREALLAADTWVKMGHSLELWDIHVIREKVKPYAKYILSVLEVPTNRADETCDADICDSLREMKIRDIENNPNQNNASGPCTPAKRDGKCSAKESSGKEGFNDWWSDEETDALYILVDKFTQNSRVGWIQMETHIKQLHASDSLCCFKASHIDKERLRSKWKSISKKNVVKK